MAPPKDIARSYPKRGLTADVGFRSEPKFCGDGSAFFDNDNATATLSTTPGSSFSYGLWMNVSDFVPSNQAVLIEIGAAGSAGSQVTITLTSTGQVQIFNGSGFIGTTAANTVSLNTWHFIAVAVDGSSGGLKIYVDGVDVTGTHTATFNVTDKGMTVGAYAPSSAFYTEGNLANVFYCTEILTQDQVRQIMRFSSSSQFATITGMESFYPLSADFNDAIGSANLTNSGATLQVATKPQLPRGLDLARGAAQARCFTGRCVDFDGSTDFLDMGLGVDKNYTTRSDRASFSVWFNADQTASVAFLYQNRHNNIGGTDRPECETQLFSTSTDLFFDGEGASVSVPMANVTIGKWHHFVGIADDSDGPVKVYLDGVLYDTTGSAQAGANGNDFVIGARNNSPLQPFNGKLSNFKIFNVELTQAQVRELYHNPEMAIPTGVSASNLRRHYPLCAYNDTGGMGGRYEIDQGVEGVNGEYGGSPVMDFAQPVPCPQLGLQQSATRLYFPGATTQTSATIPALGATASISAWFFWDDAARVSYVASVGDAGSNTNGLNIRINTSGDVTTNLNGQFDSGLNVTEGTWNHIVVTTQSSSPYWKCFVNNVEASSPAALTGAINITATNAEIGANNFSFGAAGIIADAAIWTSELSDSNVAALYNSGVIGADVSQVDSSNLIAWWKCDDLTSCKDFSGNGRSMTITTALDAVSFPENASGSTIVGDISMKRKGVSVLNFGAVSSTANEYALSAKDSAFLPSFANGGSFSCFFRLQKLGEFSSIFINDDYNSGIQHRFAAYVRLANDLTVEIGDGVSARANPDTTGTISDSEWHHFAFTIDYGGGSTTTIKLFLDGVLDSTSTATTLAGVPNATALRFGDYVTSGTNEANGPVACLKFYQVTLSENEIKQIYNSDLRLIKGLENE